MRTVLAISDSVERTQFDLSRSIGTIKDLGLDPLAVVPTFFREDNSSDSFEVTENIDYCFSECEFDAIKVGYLTNIDVMNYLYQKIGNAKNERLFLEPSLISDSGDILVSEEIYEAVCTKFAPICKLLVINTFEAELLAEFECITANDYLRAAKKIFNTYGCLVLIKASERTEKKTVLFDGFKANFILPKLVKLGFDVNKYNLATAVICFMVKGKDINSAVDSALSLLSGTYVEVEENISFPSKEEVKPLVTEETTAPAPEVFSVVTEEVAKPVPKEVVPEVVPEVKAPEVPKKPLVMPSFRVPSMSMPKTAVPSLSTKPETKPVQEEPAIQETDKTPTAESTSLVSPSKSIRDIARVLDKKESIDAEPAIATAIEKPAPGPLGEVSDLAKPSLRIKTEVSKSIVDFEELRNRLNSLNGSENK